MSEIQQATDTQKMNSKGRKWVQERRQVQMDRIIAEQSDQSAEGNTITSEQSPTSTLRRASVQDTSTTTTFLTPPTRLEEWSTMSCPPSAIRITLDPPASESTAHKFIETAPEPTTPNPVEVETASKDTTNFDSTCPTRTAECSTSRMPNTSEHHIFTTLASRKYHIPPSASLDTSSLIIFKHDTPSLERFRLLHNQLFIELGRVVEEQFQPSPFPETHAEAYRQREDLMMGLLTDVVPALNHLTERIGKEVKSSMQNYNAGLRLWVGEREKKEAES
jgi:hypothetical protein